MDKLNMQTKDLANDKFEKFKELFPNAITETIDEDGNVIRAIDKDILTQEISTKVVEGREERYQFTWPDKRKAILAANSPTSKTLRPCREESVNFDETENLYIEGDNLEVLKILQETYLGKIKMIYIDPPYNTGQNFIYNDDYSINKEEYLLNSDEIDIDGNRLTKNLETNGRFHTDWLNMMYPRLKLARNLLHDEGVILVSIDDKEQANLRKICDDIFGESNFYAEINWTATNKAMNAGNSKYKIQKSNEYILIYGKKTMREHEPLNLEIIEKKTYPHNDIVKGNYRLEEIQQRKNIGVKRSEAMVFEIPGAILKEGYRWTIGLDTSLMLLKNNEIIIKNNKPYRKIFEKDEANYSYAPLWANFSDIVGTSEKGRQILNDLFKIELEFETVKPLDLMQKLLFHFTDKNSLVLDFFSGTGTLGQAVIHQNLKDNGKRKFILVQIQEELEMNKNAYKSGFRTICDIGKERIRLAGKEIIEKSKCQRNISNLDVGMRVLKIDSSNMKDVFYSPSQTEQNILDLLEDNIKDNRTPEDLLFQVMLDLGIDLSSKIHKEIIDEKNVFIVADGFLVTCFDKSLSDDTVKEIAKKEPYYAVFRDSAMATDSVATNFDQIFENISPRTVRKVL